MRRKEHVVKLTNEEREKLLKIVKSGKDSASKITRANVLLNLDESQGVAPYRSEIAKMCQMTEENVYRLSKKFVEFGLDATIERKKRETPPVQPKVTGDVEAHIIALSCSEAPEGYSSWTLRLLAEKSVELKIIDSISHNKVGQVLKKRIKAAST